MLRRRREQADVEHRAMAVDVDDGNTTRSLIRRHPWPVRIIQRPPPVKVKKSSRSMAARPPRQLAQPPPPPPPPPAPLDADQQRALNMALADQNIFLREAPALVSRTRSTITLR